MHTFNCTCCVSFCCSSFALSVAHAYVIWTQSLGVLHAHTTAAFILQSPFHATRDLRICTTRGLLAQKQAHNFEPYVRVHHGTLHISVPIVRGLSRRGSVGTIQLKAQQSTAERGSGEREEKGERRLFVGGIGQGRSERDLLSALEQVLYMYIYLCVHTTWNCVKETCICEKVGFLCKSDLCQRKRVHLALCFPTHFQHDSNIRMA